MVIEKCKIGLIKDDKERNLLVRFGFIDKQHTLNIHRRHRWVLKTIILSFGHETIKKLNINLINDCFLRLNFP